ncbi:uncharacterized protein LOC107607331 [Arachis ipaensis]|uniref:uncharacterized protein LOC107607331 n=1 Tax=Arachis ipaensis TaxID=130454 RepID=UPI0007AF0286|nr:uncharacterized protein LOC107607331 [Arachis ipaensis]
MADKSRKQAYGLVENILVKVENLYLPADFVILDTGEDTDDSIILGRPFLATGRALIDVERRELCLRMHEDYLLFKFYANVWVTYKHVSGMNPEPKNWCTMVRWHIMELSPESVRVVLQLPTSGKDPHSYTRRVNTDQRLDQVLADICLLRAQ